jgi:glycosyltransferase involved in cell wall biosynthesis
MRILNLIPNLSGGGAERQLSYLAPALVRLNHDVHIAFSHDGPHKPELPGVMLHQLKTGSNYDPFLFWQVFRLIRNIKPDIIHTWILQMDILGEIAAKLNGIPRIFREPSSSMAYPRTWKNGLRVLASSGASAIVSNSKGGDEYWENQLPNSRRYIIPNGLPVPEIDGLVSDLPLELSNLEAPMVLFVGRLRSDAAGTKNLKVLLEALSHVRRQYKIAGILCGDGPQRSELELIVNKLGLDADVHFTGHVSATSVWTLMKKAAVFVSLSAYEGCPNTVMEAMVCGCPLVVSDIPAHHEILNESCALFVDPSSAEETADAIIATLNKSNASQWRASLAKQKTQEWTIDRLAYNYEKVYIECLHNRI